MIVLLSGAFVAWRGEGRVAFTTGVFENRGQEAFIVRLIGLLI